MIRAAELGGRGELSRYIFARAFKQSSGVPPHRYQNGAVHGARQDFAEERYRSVTEVTLPASPNEFRSRLRVAASRGDPIQLRDAHVEASGPLCAKKARRGPKGPSGSAGIHGQRIEALCRIGARDCRPSIEPCSMQIRLCYLPCRGSF